MRQPKKTKKSIRKEEKKKETQFPNEKEKVSALFDPGEYYLKED